MLFPRVKIVENLNPDDPFASFPLSELDTSHTFDNTVRKEVTSLIYTPHTSRTPTQIAYDLNILTDLCHPFIERPSRFIISTSSSSIYVEHTPLRMRLSTVIQARECSSSPFTLKEILTCGTQVLSALIYIHHPHKKHCGIGPDMPICNLAEISPDTISCSDDLTSFSLAGLWALLPELNHVPQICDERNVDVRITNQLCRILYKMATFRELDFQASRDVLQGIPLEDIKRILENSFFADDERRWTANQILEYMIEADIVKEVDITEYDSLASLSASVEKAAAEKVCEMANDNICLQTLVISTKEDLALIRAQNTQLAEERDNIMVINNELAEEAERLLSDVGEIHGQVDTRLTFFDDAMEKGNELLKLLENNNLVSSIDCRDAQECFTKVNEMLTSVSDTYNELKATEDFQDVRAAGGLEQRIQQFKKQEDTSGASLQKYDTLNTSLEASRKNNNRLREIMLTGTEHFDIKIKFNCICCQCKRKSILCKKCKHLIFCNECWESLKSIEVYCPNCREEKVQSFVRVYSS